MEPNYLLYGVFDHGWYEFQLKYWLLFLVSTKFRCQIQLQGISGGTNTVIYHVLTLEKSEKKSSLIQFHVLPINKMALGLLKWLWETSFYELCTKKKFILRRKEEFMNFMIKEKLMLWSFGSKKNLFQISTEIIFA